MHIQPYIHLVTDPSRCRLTTVMVREPMCFKVIWPQTPVASNGEQTGEDTILLVGINRNEVVGT